MFTAAIQCNLYSKVLIFNLWLHTITSIQFFSSSPSSSTQIFSQISTFSIFKFFLISNLSAVSFAIFLPTPIYFQSSPFLQLRLLFPTHLLFSFFFFINFPTIFSKFDSSPHPSVPAELSHRQSGTADFLTVPQTQHRGRGLVIFLTLPAMAKNQSMPRSLWQSLDIDLPEC